MISWIHPYCQYYPYSHRVVASEVLNEKLVVFGSQRSAQGNVERIRIVTLTLNLTPVRSTDSVAGVISAVLKLFLL